MADVSYIFPWDQGKENRGAVQILIVWLTFGSIMNASQLFLHSAIGQLRKQPICRIIIWLSSIDFAFDFICLIQCSLNYHFKKFFGEEILCTAQAFWAELLITMSGFSISCILLASYMTIIYNRTLTTKEIDKLHLGALLYCLLLSFLGVIKPGSGTLNPSGLICYTAAHRLVEGLLFHVGYILPLICTLIYLWYRIYRRVKDMTKFLATRKLNIEARKGQVRMAKRMAWYIYFFLLCFFPYEIALWYAWITGKHAPAPLWITFSMLAHLLTVANPILYYVLNQSARHIVYERCSRFFCRSQIALSEAIRRSSLSGLNPSANKEAYQLEELTRALSDTEVLNQMLAFADEKFCSEPIHFWIDVQVWKTMCSKIFTPQNTPAETPLIPDRDLDSSANGLLGGSPSGSPDGKTSARSSLIRYAQATNKRESIEMGNLILFASPEEKESKVGAEKEENMEVKDTDRGDLEELREFGKSVYLTYFIKDGAPLELNIGDRNIARVVRELKIKETKDGPVCRIEHTPKIVHLFDVAEHECLRLLYDNVYRPFCAKIQMDDVLKNQERLKNLHSGDVLPWKTDGDNDREGSRGPSRRSSRTPSRRGIDYTQVILPKGAGGGVSTRKLKQGNDQEESVSRSHANTEHSVSRSNNSIEMTPDSGSMIGNTFKLLYTEQGGGTFSVRQHEEEQKFQQQQQQSDSSNSHSPANSIRSSSGAQSPKLGSSFATTSPSATPILKSISIPPSITSTPIATPVLKSLSLASSGGLDGAFSLTILKPFDESEEPPEEATPRKKKPVAEETIQQQQQQQQHTTILSMFNKNENLPSPAARDSGDMYVV